MKALSEEILIRQLKWRYATKKFDPARKIASAEWQTLEQAMVHTPSSCGLQPWHFFVIDDPAVRARLRPAAYNQPQIVDASHLVVFAVKNNMAAADVEKHLSRIVEVRNIPQEALAGYKQMMLGVVGRGAEEVDHWARRQVFIALGFFLSAAAMLGIDVCPMEGFEPEKFDAMLGLPEKGYSAVVLATAGYRAADDVAAKMAKVRFNVEEVITHI